MIRSVLSWRRSGVRESATLCRLDQCGSQCSCPGVSCSVCLEPRASSWEAGEDFDSGQQWGVAAGPFCLYGREMGMACRATAHIFPDSLGSPWIIFRGTNSERPIKSANVMSMLRVARATVSQTIAQGPITIFFSEQIYFVLEQFFLLLEQLKNYSRIK